MGDLAALRRKIDCVQKRLQGRRKSPWADCQFLAAQSELDAALAKGPTQPDGCADADFTALRPKHIYAVEIELLLAQVEAAILEKRGWCRRWSQALIWGLQHGIGLHITEPGCEGINFAVQLLFRIGHVQVLLAGEELGCGMNLP